ncbi:flavin reductase family protein [Kribbella sancticallisti]|uniref:Flavin reductase family protein n=2 Tax=Kribbella sancticallisti TaxID=460087 RepID=A0ABN2EL89_9ACTN
MTANSFLSVSLDPLLMLVSIAQQATMCQVLEASSSFAVSILAEGQADISNHFAGRRPGLPGTPLATVAAAPEAQVVTGAAAWMVLDKTAMIDAGDHRLFLGAPTVIEASQSAPLVFHGGRYHELREGFDAHLLAFL